MKIRSGVIWNPINAKCQYNYANTLFSMKKYDEAKYHYEKSISIYPKVGALYNLAYLLQTTQNQVSF